MVGVPVAEEFNVNIPVALTVIAALLSRFRVLTSPKFNALSPKFLALSVLGTKSESSLAVTVYHLK